MKTCTHCNLNFHDSLSFCNKCGGALEHIVVNTEQTLTETLSKRDMFLLLAVLLLEAFRVFISAIIYRFIAIPLFRDNNHELGKSVIQHSGLILAILVFVFTLVSIFIVERKVLKFGLGIFLALDLLGFLIYRTLDSF